MSCWKELWYNFKINPKEKDLLISQSVNRNLHLDKTFLIFTKIFRKLFLKDSQMERGVGASKLGCYSEGPSFKFPTRPKWSFLLSFSFHLQGFINVTSFLSIPCLSNSEHWSQKTSQNGIKTLFNSCERLLLGTLILDIDIGITGLRSEQIVWPYPQHNGERT